MTRTTLIATALAAAGTLSSLSVALAATPGTTFSYQGELRETGVAVTTPIDVRFTLYNDAGGTSQVGSPIVVAGITPVEGVFGASLDFGVSAFEANEALWLGVEVSNAGLDLYDDLGLQPLEAAPFALNTRGLKVFPGGQLSVGADGLGSTPDGSSITLNTPGGTIPGITMIYGDGFGGTDTRWDTTVEADGSYRIRNNTVVAAPFALTIDDQDYVGLGTTDPERKLHVRDENGVIRVDRNTTIPAIEFNRYPDGDNFTSTPWARWQIGAGGVGQVSEFRIVDSTDLTVTRMLIDGSGFVGLGTEDPERALHIESFNPRLLIEGNSGSTFAGTLSRMGGHEFSAGLCDPLSGATRWELFDQGAGQARLSVATGTGFVGIGVADPQAALHVIGDTRYDGRLNIGGPGFGNVTSNIRQVGTDPIILRVADASETNLWFAIEGDGDITSKCGFLCSSDARLKENVSTLGTALDDVLALRGVSFDWIDETMAAKGTQLGFIAQEVEAIAPELVSTDDEGYKSVRYANVTALLVEATKAQQSEIESLSRRVASLESRLESVGSPRMMTSSLAWPAFAAMALAGLVAARRRQADV